MDQCEECPLCMEPLEMDDINFFPCTCLYQICRFCWHRLRTNENGLCPACRKPYTECPADYKPLTQEELQKVKQMKKQKELQRKQKVTESRKHLANVRVVQKNLVFVVGLSPRLADVEVLKKGEYFGKFGKIHKVVINHSNTYAGSQGPSACAYVTYQRSEDALRAIANVNNIHVDGRTLKASLGTTKYCSHFMKNQTCPKTDCMYLHELGDEAASFTKEEMQQGKHQDFEKKLQEQFISSGKNCSDNTSHNNNINNKRSHKDSLSEVSSATPTSQAGGRSSGVVSSTNGGSTSGIQPLDSIVINPSDCWPLLHNNAFSTKDSSATHVTAAAVVAGASVGNGGTAAAAPSQQSCKKGRKHNNSTSAGIVANNGTSSSPRRTPTREHITTSRRNRTEENGSGCRSSSNSNTSSNRESPSVTSMTELASNYALFTDSEPTGQVPECVSSTDVSNLCPSKHRSALSKHNPKRQKSQSPNTTPSEECEDRPESRKSVISSGEASHDSSRKSSSSVPPAYELRMQEVELPPSNTSDQSDRLPHSTGNVVESVDMSQILAEEQAVGEVTAMSSLNNSSPHEAISRTSAEDIDDDGNDILNSINNAVISEMENTSYHKPFNGEWSREESEPQQRVEERVWCALPVATSSELQDDTLADDGLDFDPCAESLSALAEEIAKEKLKREQEERQQQTLQLQQLSQPVHDIQAAYKNFTSNYSVYSAAKLPPPGFNGSTTLATFSALQSQQQQQRVDASKMQQFINASGLSNASPLNGLVNAGRNAPANIAVLAALQQQNNSTVITLDGGGGIEGSGGPHHSAALLNALDQHALSQHAPPPPPPGLALPKQQLTQDAFVMKELENSLRPFANQNALNVNSLNMINNTINAGVSSNASNVASFSTFNGLNALPNHSLVSLNSGLPLTSASTQNSNTAFSFGMTNNQQQHPQHQSHLSALNSLSSYGCGIGVSLAQQSGSPNSVLNNLLNLAPSQQSVLHQLALHNLQKTSWTSSGGGAANNSLGTVDLTALDPAIVSSGQPTDSRSDSPPEWLRNLEQHSESSPWTLFFQQQGSSSASSTNPSSCVAAAAAAAAAAANVQRQQLVSNSSGLHLSGNLSNQQSSILQQHLMSAAAVQHLRQQQQQQSVWPPTSPPPGFSSISPLHQTKLQHKIDNL